MSPGANLEARLPRGLGSETRAAEEYSRIRAAHSPSLVLAMARCSMRKVARQILQRSIAIDIYPTSTYTDWQQTSLRQVSSPRHRLRADAPTATADAGAFYRRSQRQEDEHAGHSLGGRGNSTRISTSETPKRISTGQAAQGEVDFDSSRPCHNLINSPYAYISWQITQLLQQVLPVLQIDPTNLPQHQNGELRDT